MRILLAHNSLYYPSHGGGDRSNRLLMEALAAQGHEVRVVARIERFGPEAHDAFLSQLTSRGIAAEVAAPEIRMKFQGVDVRTLTLDTHWRGFFSSYLEAFDPDVILASTDDPAQLLLEVAIRAPRARVVYLVRATIAAPVGPDASAPNALRAETLRRCDGVVGVSEYVARYMRQWGGLDAIHLPISLLEPGEPSPLARFHSPYVTLANPCAVKGISIFLALVDRMPQAQFAAVPTWGTNGADLASLRSRPNVVVLDPVENIDDLLRQTKILLVPSLWAEARSRIVVEAMARGVPVIASDIGGIPEAKLGVPYLIPVNPIVRYHAAVDENMVPVAQVPAQDIGPWKVALRRLLEDREHYEQLSVQSRVAALEYARNLSVRPFEQFLEKVLQSPKRLVAEAQPAKLSADKQKLLTMRLRQRATPKREENSWLPFLEAQPTKPRLFCFPYAGSGALPYRPWIAPMSSAVSVCPVRLPGRETRMNEQAFEDMPSLIESLHAVIAPYLNHPFAFFGHSMGAMIAFELTRSLRRHCMDLPFALYASGARAPHFRLNWTPPPAPNDGELLDELRRLDGIPAEMIQNPHVMEYALPVLRADVKLYRNYVYTAESPLPIPVFTYGGQSDPNVSMEHLDAWRVQTAGAFARREFPGGHFFLYSAAASFQQALMEDLKGFG